MLGVQLPRPFSKVQVPGLNPNDPIATTDSEIELIKCKLTETGKTLRYCGQGINDLYVNTVDPNTGLFVQDLDYGPKVKINVLRPVGFAKAWYIEWQAVFTVESCCSTEVDFNNPALRIQEFNYSLDYNRDIRGYLTRRITGRLVILPPMDRRASPLGPLGQNPAAVANNKNIVINYNNHIQILELANNALTAANKTLDAATLALNNLVAKLDAGVANGLGLRGTNALNIIIQFFNNNIDIPTLAKNINKQQPQIDIPTATNLINLYIAVVNAAGPATDAKQAVLVAQAIVNNDILQAQLNFKIALPVAQTPTYESLFPKNGPDINGATLPVTDPKIAFGPYSVDNIGNKQNYETVDQYWNIVYNRFPVPYNFERTNAQNSISDDKRTMRFSITDAERPSFSFVPGYSKVSGSHSISSDKPFAQWMNTIHCNFILPKFISAQPGPNQLAAYSDIQAANGLPGAAIPNAKLAPTKTTAYIDFLKIIFQRFALALAAQSKNNKGKIGYQVLLPTGQVRTVRYNMLMPVAIDSNENLFDNEISFTMRMLVIADIESIWQVTGVGLPAIIAADIDSSGVKLLGNNASPIQQYAARVFFGRYTDLLVHRDWLESQKYAGVSPRGGADYVYLDRTMDFPLNICATAQNPGVTVDNALPYHGFSDQLGGLGAVARNKISLAGEVPNNGDPNPPVNIYRQSAGDVIVKVSGKNQNNWGVKTGGGVALKQLESTAFSDIDVFLNDNLVDANPNQGGPYIYEQSYKLDIGSINNTTFSGNTGYNQTDTSGVFWEGYSSGQLVTNLVMQLMGSPTPARSWIAYSSAIEIVTDTKVCRHTLLPKQDITRLTTIDQGFDNFLENHFADPIPLGPDNLLGYPLDSVTVPEQNRMDAVLQTTGIINKVRLIGYAVRVGFQPIPPTLLQYGGQQATQRKQTVRRAKLTMLSDSTFGCTWDIEYELANTPSGALTVPDLPDLTQDSEYTNIEQEQADVLDEYVLSQADDPADILTRS